MNSNSLNKRVERLEKKDDKNQVIGRLDTISGDGLVHIGDDTTLTEAEFIRLYPDGLLIRLVQKEKNP